MLSNLKIFGVSISLVFFCSGIVYSQTATTQPDYSTQSPSVSAMLRFDETPAATHTGVPDISIPLISLDSHTQGIGVNLGLSYHPSGAAYHERAGEVGKGWSIATVGVISRDLDQFNKPDEFWVSDPDLHDYYMHYLTIAGSNLYQYNFMGYSGKFILNFVEGGIDNIEIIESKPSPIRIDFTPSPGNNFKVESFTIYDNNGNKYVFDQSDTVTGRFMFTSDANPWAPQSTVLKMTHRPTWYLSRVVDKAKNDLIINTFEDRNVPNNGDIDVYKKITVSEVKDKGRIFFTYAQTGDNENNDNFLLKDISLKRVTDTITIKKFKFKTGLDFRGKFKLLSVEQSVSGTSEKLVHKFDYNTMFGQVGGATYRADKYGYYKRTDLCDSSVGNYDTTDPVYCTLGVLNKVIYPGGGYTKYEWESNTFSPTNYSFENYANEPHNIVTEQFYPGPEFDPVAASIYPFEFTVTEPGIYYLKITNPGYPTPIGVQPAGIVYSQMDLLKSNIVYTRAGKSYNYLSTDDNNNNECLGLDIYLEAGNYKFNLNPYSSINNSGAKAFVKRKLVNNSINKFLYGGGLRIKTISHFDGANSVAAKTVDYSYNLFDNPSQSSAFEAINTYFDNSLHTHKAKQEMVSYKNVAVRESGKGRTEYTFINSEGDKISADSLKVTPWYEYKKGLLLGKRTFDEAGNKLTEVINDYEFDGDTIQVVGKFYDRNGWVRKTTTKNLNYFYEGNTQSNTQVTSIVAYNNNRLTDYTRSNTESASDVLESRYYYFTHSSLNSSDFFETDRIETRRGGELIGVQKTNYTAGDPVNPQINVPGFLRHVDNISAAKGSDPLEAKVRFLSYDVFENPLELKQENGNVVSYIWGHGKTQPIAKIENATYTQIAAALGITVATLKGYTESNITALNSLRTLLPNAMVTTYTYLPLIGVKTITDPRGYTMQYEYDAFGRLKQVKDMAGNILSENQYHYIPQN
jgi:YD repeat-containing protein